MKRKIVAVVVVAVALAGVGGVVAAPLAGMQAWAASVGTNKVATNFAVYGITNMADRVAVSGAWDQDTLVDTALRERAYGLIGFAMGRDKLTTVNVARVKAAVLAETVPPVEVLEVVTRFPLGEREQFRAVVEAAGAVRYAKQPEYGHLMVNYSILRAGGTFGPDVSEEELVRFLVAPEILPLVNAENCKKAIKERAVALARMKLRADGKSFVVKDGVNPLVLMVQPVVAALNAPDCVGLEAALRVLGSAIPDMDRKPMEELVAGWQPKMMSGEMSPSEVTQVLGKIAVVLGPEGYNRFVDAYNNGTAGAQ